MITESEIKTVAKFTKDSVEFLKKEDRGCCHRSYNGDLCLVVGWMPGYGDEKTLQLIQASLSRIMQLTPVLNFVLVGCKPIWI